MASASSSNASGSNGSFSEMMVIKAFHIFTINSLSQAKLEGLLDEDTLASAEADVMICGPALCLFFAALRSTSDPPSVPIPGRALGLDSSAPPLALSAATCPPVFQPFFRLWAQSVPAIQALPSASQHDLARIICDKDPISAAAQEDSGQTGPGSSVTLMRIAADIRAVAIEITQRRTFQERYQQDLQSALDAGVPAPAPGASSEKRRVASFAPPPSYDETQSLSPASSAHSSPQRQPAPIPPQPSPGRLNAALPPTPNAPPNVEGMQSLDGVLASQEVTVPPSSSHLSPTPAGSSTRGHRSRPSSPTFLPPDSPAINLIRETLYAALGEVIAMTPSIVPVLRSDPARAYFSVVSLAILTVSTDCITESGGVITPLGRELTVAECPVGYRPLMMELGGISNVVKRMRDEDDDKAMEQARSGLGEPFEPRLDRLKRMLERGVANEEARYDAFQPLSATSPEPIPTQGPPAPAPVPVPVPAPAPAPAMPVPTIPASAPVPVAPPSMNVKAGKPTPVMPIPKIPSGGNGLASAILSSTSNLHSPPPNQEPRFTTPEQDQQLLNPVNSRSEAQPSSSHSSPRSSGEHSRLGLRGLLRKPRPESPEKAAAAAATEHPPPIAAKPSPPSPGRYAPPNHAPPSNMAGVGAGRIAPTNSPPRAAMMMHQGTVSATGNPYETALGSGARIPGSESGILNASAPTSTATVPAATPPTTVAAADAAPAPAPAGVTRDVTHSRRSLEGSTVQLANRINGLSLKLTGLRMFQERQDMVFKILASVHD